MPRAAKIRHPYINENPAISGGSPVISGTRVRVVDIAIEYDRLGMTPDEIADAHPHLTLKAIHDALSVYYANREAFDRGIGLKMEKVKQLSRKYPSKLKTAVG